MCWGPTVNETSGTGKPGPAEEKWTSGLRVTMRLVLQEAESREGYNRRGVLCERVSAWVDLVQMKCSVSSPGLEQTWHGSDESQGLLGHQYEVLTSPCLSFFLKLLEVYLVPWLEWLTRHQPKRELDRHLEPQRGCSLVLLESLERLLKRLMSNFLNDRLS